jgi:phosphoribosyl 1,2-cyclic phosphodiesterase
VRNPKNRRRRTSLLVERQTGDAVTRVLVDTSPDLREQLLATDVDWLDAVFYTHEHADHTHGIDDLRALSFTSVTASTSTWISERRRPCTRDSATASRVCPAAIARRSSPNTG